MFIPDDLCYWLTFTKLYGWTLSGIATAILVFLMTEFCFWRRSRACRIGLSVLLNDEISANISQFDYIHEGIGFRFDVWERSKIELAKFVSKEDLSLLCTLYDWFYKIQNNPLIFAGVEVSSVTPDTQQLQKRIEKSARKYFR